MYLEEPRNTSTVLELHTCGNPFAGVVLQKDYQKLYGFAGLSIKIHRT